MKCEEKEMLHDDTFENKHIDKGILSLELIDEKVYDYKVIMNKLTIYGERKNTEIERAFTDGTHKDSANFTYLPLRQI